MIKPAYKKQRQPQMPPIGRLLAKIACYSKPVNAFHDSFTELPRDQFYP
jgi:hypothetical protein